MNTGDNIFVCNMIKDLTWQSGSEQTFPIASTPVLLVVPQNLHVPGPALPRLADDFPENKH